MKCFFWREQRNEHDWNMWICHSSNAITLTILMFVQLQMYKHQCFKKKYRFIKAYRHLKSEWFKQIDFKQSQILVFNKMFLKIKNILTKRLQRWLDASVQSLCCFCASGNTSTPLLVQRRPAGCMRAKSVLLLCMWQHVHTFTCPTKTCWVHARNIIMHCCCLFELMMFFLVRNMQFGHAQAI